MSRECVQGRNVLKLIERVFVNPFCRKISKYEEEELTIQSSRRLQMIHATNWNHVNKEYVSLLARFGYVSVFALFGVYYVILYFFTHDLHVLHC
jgi:hypothetical protein